VEHAHEIVNEWKIPTIDAKYELEVRLGKWCGQHFESGVSKQFFENIIHLLTSFHEWTNVTEWEETHDFYFSTIKDSNIRVTTSFHMDEKTGKKTIQTEQIKKVVKKKLDFRYVCFQGQCNEGYDIRVNMNVEEKVPKSDLPQFINPSSVRIKSRKSFMYKSENHPSAHPIWKFDLTRCWYGTSKSEAEQNQKENYHTNYEIELECMDPHVLMSSETYDSVYVMTSMMLKISDLFENPHIRWEKIKNDNLQQFPNHPI
jgi:hypothetical protein